MKLKNHFIMPKGHWKKLTAKEEQFILDNYLDQPIKRVAASINISHGRVMRFLKKKGLEIPKEIIEQRKKASQFNKGHEPMNKGLKQTEYMTAEAIKRTKSTRFKKGDQPHNTHPDGDGAISIRKESNSDKSYKYIRVNVGEWELYHKYLWEQEHGKVPEGHCLWFKDGNSMNCDLSNLELITRAENIDRNWHSRYPSELKNSIKKLNKLKRTLKEKTT